MNTRCALAIAAALVSAAPALADPLTVETRLLVENRVAASDGTTRTRLVPPRKLVPGDQVTVLLAYRNGSRTTINNLVLANPVPRGMAYRASAPGSPAPELSVDGRSFGPLASLRLRGPEGRLRPATAADVTDLRWRLSTPVAAGAAGTVSFQAVIR